MSKPDPAADPSDADLVARARAGARPAFEALVRRHQRPLYFLILRYAKDRDEAADLVQRTFIRAMSGLGELRETQLFRTWLYRIGVNLALNHLRDHARFVDDEGEAAEVAIDPVGSERLEAAEGRVALQRAVETLPTKQRMTLELRVFQELSFKEIAEVMDTTEGAAKVNFHYAVKKLRVLLGERSEGGVR